MDWSCPFCFTFSVVVSGGGLEPVVVGCGLKLLVVVVAGLLLAVVDCVCEVIIVVADVDNEWFGPTIGFQDPPQHFEKTKRKNSKKGK